MLQTKYVSIDEFQEYFVDIDLRKELGNEENALGFLKRIEDRLERFINAEYNRNITREYPQFTDYQKENYKMALLEEAIYIFRNSDLFVDSGYDTERGEIIDYNKLEKISISRETIKALRICGIVDRNVYKRTLFTGTPVYSGGSGSPVETKWLLELIEKAGYRLDIALDEDNKLFATLYDKNDNLISTSSKIAIETSRVVVENVEFSNNKLIVTFTDNTSREIDLSDIYDSLDDLDERLSGVNTRLSTVESNYFNKNNVVDNTQTTDPNKALSANMGANLQDQINNLKARGRFLALWNATTGLAETVPSVNPYEYKTGDYFIVGVVGATNYKPSGSEYDKDVPSTAVETNVLNVDDVYYYDGTTWHLQVNTRIQTQFANIGGSPYDNTNLANALNSKTELFIADYNRTTGKAVYDAYTAGKIVKAYYGGRLCDLNEVNSSIQGIFKQFTFAGHYYDLVTHKYYQCVLTLHYIIEDDPTAYYWEYNIEEIYSAEQVNDLLDDKVDKENGKSLISDTEKQEIADNTSARHTHSNKAILDTLTDNQSALDTKFNNKQDKVYLSIVNGMLCITYNE